ncbi:MAG: FtsX-like permease family protein [Verrucomicrobia bacterium]|nr:FtsX-like permease family protein [Verrucomicrobiota bacterium]
MQLSGFFSGFSLLLASLGLYGFLSYGVLRRTREIGVRVALGAQARDVVAHFLRRGLWLVLFGCFLGIAGALAGARLLGSLLYGVSPVDPLTYAGVAGLLMMVAVPACLLPARRAAKFDSMIALRSE